MDSASQVTQRLNFVFQHRRPQNNNLYISPSWNITNDASLCGLSTLMSVLPSPTFLSKSLHSQSKTALAPTTSGRKHDVLNQYTALKAYNKKQSIDKWLNS